MRPVMNSEWTCCNIVIRSKHPCFVVFETTRWRVCTLEQFWIAYCDSFLIYIDRGACFDNNDSNSSCSIFKRVSLESFKSQYFIVRHILKAQSLVRKPKKSHVPARKVHWCQGLHTNKSFKNFVLLSSSRLYHTHGLNAHSIYFPWKQDTWTISDWNGSHQEIDQQHTKSILCCFCHGIWQHDFPFVAVQKSLEEGWRAWISHSPTKLCQCLSWQYMDGWAHDVIVGGNVSLI